MNVATVKHLHSQSIVQQKLVVALLDEVKASYGEYDLAVLVVRVDDVWGSAAEGLLVRDSFDDPVGVEPVALGRGKLGVPKIWFVNREYDAADTWDWLELFGGGSGPGGAVV